MKNSLNALLLPGFFEERQDKAVKLRGVGEDECVSAAVDHSQFGARDLLVECPGKTHRGQEIVITGYRDVVFDGVIGTGSMRRRAQLKTRFPHLAFAEIRGIREEDLPPVLPPNVPI